MKTTAYTLKPHIVSLALLMASSAFAAPAFAQPFPCQQGNCSMSSKPVASKPLANKSAEPASSSTDATDKPIANSSEQEYALLTASYPFLNQLQLTDQQRGVLSSLIDKQAPTISANVTSLENARALLRQMALAKQYDESIANIAAERIANSTANLALLQAEREFSIFTLLTPEQSKQFAIMQEKGEINLM